MRTVEKYRSLDNRLEFDADDDCVHFDAFGKPYAIANIRGKDGHTQRRIPLRLDSDTLYAEEEAASIRRQGGRADW